MEGEHGNGGSKHSGMHPEKIRDDSDQLLQGKISSSSSSSSSFDPLSESDAEKGISHKSEQDGTSSPRRGPISSIDVSSQTPEWSMVSASPRSGPGFSTQNPDWSMTNASPTQSPPIQMMGRPTGYDPNRIPSSVFASKPASQMEWSVASNESLFSINMGNNSFSRDRAILLGKSGELSTIDESNNSPLSPHPVSGAESNELHNLPSSLPTVPESAAGNDRKNADMGNSQVKAAAYDNPRVGLGGTAEHHSKEKMTPAEGSRTSGSTARLSNESGNSGSSFAFPVLEGAGGKSGSAKVGPEKSQPQTPVATTKAAENKWFPCFSCCPFCC